MIVEIKVPMLAESVAEAILLDWHKQPGESVKRGDNLIDIETDKVMLEVAATNDGILVEVLRQAGDQVESDEIIARIDTAAEAATTPTETPTASAATEENNIPVLGDSNIPVLGETVVTTHSANDSNVKQSPAVRKLVEENSIDTTQVTTANSDRITKSDVLNHLNQNNTTTAETVTPLTTAIEKTQTPITSAADGRAEERVPMTRLRKRAAERLLQAQHNNAILTTFNEVNMQPIMDLRAKYKDEFQRKYGVKLGFMSFFTKASTEALKQFPLLNASVDDDDIIYHGYFDIGIAVSSSRGLVVPILRDADLMPLADIESTIRSFGEKAESGKLTIEELTGGTFTITNGGVFGSLLSTPILNPPQSAILGMHKIQERPVVEDGKIIARPMMYLALSYDHRIIDGRDAVQFLVTVKELLEDPSRLLLQV